MSDSAPSSTIETVLQSKIRSRLLTEQCELLIGSELGVILKANAALARAFQPNRTPIVLPDSLPLFGRESTISTILTALQIEQNVEIYGAAGIGKTALLRTLIHHPEIEVCQPDGVLYFERSQSASDLIQAIFDQFYQSSAEVKPTIAEMRSHLSELRALVVLDHATLSREDFDTLLNTLPAMTLLVASTERQFWQADQAIEISGLGIQAGLALIERSGFDHAAATQLIERVHGHPQRLLQLSALAPQTVTQLRDSDEIAQFMLNQLSEAQHRILMLLTALDQVGLSAAQISAIASLADPLPELQVLIERHFVQVEQDRYRATSGFSLGTVDTTAWMERVLTCLVEWIDQPRSQAELIEAQALIMAALRWCVQQKRWETVLKLTRSTESTVAIAREWGRWQQLLRWSLDAAWALEDEAIEAWALHQLGTLAFCQEQVTAGYDALNQALTLRSTLGDETASTYPCSEAIALTQHNIEQIKALIVPVSIPQINQRNWIVVTCAIGLITAIVAVIVQITR